MTAQEQRQLSHLYDQIVTWRREDSDRIIQLKDDLSKEVRDALEEHAGACPHGMSQKQEDQLAWLYQNAQARCAEAQAREEDRRKRERNLKMWFAGIGSLCAVVGAASPYIIHWLHGVNVL